MITLDPALFDEKSISAETRLFNAETIAKLSALPDQWSVAPEVSRRNRALGRGPFPLPPENPRAETIEIPGPRGPVPLRILPAKGAPNGIYLHIHGGGWVLGTADQQDDRLTRIAENCGQMVISVEYGLAPEEPYPAGPDDCEAAALWLIENSPRFGTDRLTIGGESAGAHLAVVTMLRLRDRHGLTPFRGANLTAGCFDLALTPSVRSWGDDKLILNTRDIEMFVAHFLCRGGAEVTDPDISPMNADLSGLPPALFSVGTLDLLLDDTLFMAQRWAAAGNPTKISIAPGGCHVFQAFPLEITEKSLAEIDTFLTTAASSPVNR